MHSSFVHKSQGGHSETVINCLTLDCPLDERDLTKLSQGISVPMSFLGRSGVEELPVMWEVQASSPGWVDDVWVETGASCHDRTDIV